MNNEMPQRVAWFGGTQGKVRYRRWDPVGPATKIVQIVHGYAEHGGRYGHVAAALNAVGAVVYADDHLGHGESAGERALITDFEHVVDDLHHLYSIAHEEFPGLPFFLVGHSMGGLLSGRFGQRWPQMVAGIAFCGSVIGDWVWLREALELDELPEVPFDPTTLSRDPQVGADYAADPLVYHGQYKRGLLEAEAAALDRFQANMAALTMPILFMHGTEDPFVPYAQSLRAVEEMPAIDKTVRVLDGARHEVLNESNRDEIIGYLTGWIERVASARN